MFAKRSIFACTRPSPRKLLRNVSRPKSSNGLLKWAFEITSTTKTAVLRASNSYSSATIQQQLNRKLSLVRSRVWFCVPSGLHWPKYTARGFCSELLESGPHVCRLWRRLGLLRSSNTISTQHIKIWPFWSSQIRQFPDTIQGFSGAWMFLFCLPFKFRGYESTPPHWTLLRMIFNFEMLFDPPRV